jgi:hypothetical protein
VAAFIELFDTASTRPEAVFCDTSFVLDVLIHELPAVRADIRKLDSARVTKAAQAAAFFHAYRRDGIQFVSSPFMVQEAAHSIAKNALQANSKFNLWKDLRTKDPATFTTARAAAIRTIHDAWNHLQGYGISLVAPPIDEDDPSQGDEVNKRLSRAALLLLRRHDAIDPMDAFFISVGLACGFTWFATTDQGWKDVTGIGVFCDK